MFEKWYLEELISKTIRDIWKLTDYFLLKLISNILDKAEITPLLKSGTTVDSIIQKKDYPAKVYASLKWLLDRLKLDGFVSMRLENNVEFYTLSDKTMNYDLNTIKSQAEKASPESIAAFNMLELMANNYPDYLSGKKTGVDIVFSPENIDITNEYYSNNLFYNVHNISGAKIVNWDISSRKNPQILEIGGGLGGGTKQFVIQRLKDKAPLNVFNYCFTDVANKMLRSTKKALSTLTEDLSAFTFQKLDFNKNLSEQGYAENSYDVIWGVNAAHVSFDMRFSLNELFKTLKSGGSLIISETVRPIGNLMIQQEFVLNTLDDYWNVKLDEKIRPRHGFMDWSDWIGAFKEIGFINVETIPDMSVLQKEYDNCYVTVVRGIKP